MVKRKLFSTLSLLAAALLLGTALLPYPLLRSLGDHLSRDGSLAILTPSVAAVLRAILLLLAAGLAALGAFLLARRDGPARLVSALSAAWGRFWQDARTFWRAAASLPVATWEWAALAAALAVGLCARLVLLRAPIQYDEAYTFIAFASHPAASILTDYSLPNNHVLHTLLVRAAFLLFGSPVWVLRLPAFLAGLAGIPAAWLAARAHTNRLAAVLAAMLFAAWPYAVHYSASARGYSLIALFTLLLFALGPHLLATSNRFAWLLVVLVSTLGLFTVPVMLYPLGVFYAWLFLSVLAGEVQPARQAWRFLAACAAAGLVTLLLAALLYAPILLVSGPRAMFDNVFVRRVGWVEFRAMLGVWLRGILDTWEQDLPPPTFFLAAAAWLLALFVQPRVSRRKTSTTAAALLFFALILPIQRPELQAKAFYFLIPLFLIASSAGMAFLLALPRRSPRLAWLTPLFTILLLAAVAWGALSLARRDLPYLLRSDPSDLEQAAVYLQGRVQPGDLVLATYPIDPQLWYYGYRHGLDQGYFRAQTYTRAWAVVMPGLGQSLRGVLNPPGATPSTLQPADCALDHQILDLRIYLCTPSSP